MRVLLSSGIVAGIAMSLFFAPAGKEVHAGAISFFAGILGGDGVRADIGEEKYNSQNIVLLEAPLSPKLAIGGGGITIVDDTALAYQDEIDDEVYRSDQISTYVVRDGDTLSQIAQMFSVSVNTIVWANDLNGGLITPGQNLAILPVSGTRHIVKNGDTPQSIAKQYGGDLKEILQFNNIADGVKLAVGDEIIVPDGDAVSPKSSVSGGSSKPNIAGYYIRPISGGRKTQGIHGYNGVDLAAPIGTKIVASAGGKVIISRNSGYNGGYGKYIVVSHPNGTQTLYAHLNETAVTQGMTVGQGQLIGYVGNTGRSTGPHIHFEIRGAKNPF